MAVLCWMNTIQYSPRSGQLSVCKLFTSCIRWCVVSRDCDWVMSALSAALLIFGFHSHAFLLYIGRQAASALRRIGFNTRYQTSDVSENLGKYFSCTERTAKREDFELILTVKMETRHTVQGQFGNEFRAICNHFYGRLKSQNIKICILSKLLHRLQPNLAMFAFLKDPLW